MSLEVTKSKKNAPFPQRQTNMFFKQSMNSIRFESFVTLVVQTKIERNLFEQNISIRRTTFDGCKKFIETKKIISLISR